MQHVPDPYRVLGVQRAATPAQIKAAHRKLAKRYHPDAAEGDTSHFLAVQEAYLLLADPLRRRDWDARHAPGPVRAGEGATRARGRGGAGRWTRE
ncbi:MAG: J domain-containing protein, partial [Chloroflexota bacterium]|nr:J domain-containing protein [Chloroflexota bacterium]